jgi:hypothetical protein
MRLEHRRSTEEYRKELEEIFSKKTNIQETPSLMSIMSREPDHNAAALNVPHPEVVEAAKRKQTPKT